MLELRGRATRWKCYERRGLVNTAGGMVQTVIWWRSRWCGLRVRVPNVDSISWKLLIRPEARKFSVVPCAILEPSLSSKMLS